MKRIVVIWISVFLLMGLATSAFAFGPGWGGHERYDRQQGYGHGWQESGGHERGKHVRGPGYDRGWRNDDRHYSQPAYSYGSGAGVVLPVTPLPGFGFWFPGISISIH